MGFFSGIRRRIKKLIPKEVRPFVPYIAAGIPFAAPGGLGALGAKHAMQDLFYSSRFSQRSYSDDEANLKDIARAGAISSSFLQALDANYR